MPTLRFDDGGMVELGAAVVHFVSCNTVAHGLMLDPPLTAMRADDFQPGGPAWRAHGRARRCADTADFDASGTCHVIRRRDRWQRFPGLSRSPYARLRLEHRPGKPEVIGAHHWSQALACLWANGGTAHDVPGRPGPVVDEAVIAQRKRKQRSV
jgi:hypothetical protein